MRCWGIRITIAGLLLVGLAAALPGIAPALAQSDDLNAINVRVVELLDAGRFAEAMPLASRSVELAKARHGENDPRYALAINNMAQLLKATFRLSEAEPLMRRALAIDEERLGPEHPDVARDLSNLAALLYDTSRLTEAEPLYRRALAIDEKNFGPDHPMVAIRLNNLSALLHTTNRASEAEPLMRRAIAIDEKNFAPEHPRVAIRLSNLARLLQDTNRSVDAEPLMRRALAIDEKSFGPEHPKVAIRLNNLARLLHDTNRLFEAEPLMWRALAIDENSFVPNHPNIGIELHNLAALQADLGRWMEAAHLYQRAKAAITGTRARANTRYLRAAARAAYRADGTNKETLQQGFEFAQWALQTEAADALAQMSARFAKGGGVLADLVRERQDLLGRRRGEMRLLDKAAGAADAKGTERARSAVATLDKLLDATDARLGGEFKEYADLANPNPLTVTAAQALLARDELLVLLVDVPRIAGSPEETLIWIVSKEHAHWHSVPIGTENLRERVAALRCGLDEEEWSGTTRANKCAALLGRKDKPDDDDPPPFDLGIAHQLYQSLFGPVEDLIKGKRLLIVPSGPLTSLPFHVLVTKKPETAMPVTFEGYRNVAWLARSHAITVLPSVASLSALRTHSAKRERAPADYIGIGNPILTGTSGECRESKVPDRCPTVEVAGSPRPHLTVATMDQGMVHPRRSRRNAGKGLGEVYAKGADPTALIKQVRAMCPLPDTDYELRCVAERFPRDRHDLYRDKLATETDLRKLNADGTLARYRIVHFATHGLVAGDIETMAKRQGEPALVLTPPDQPADADDDGLLTASEVAQLRLNADWVVLSACSTAAGDGANAEALSGLARAFFYAGTRALLVSHWPVYSDAAVQLTTRTFAELDRDPATGRAEAFRRAMVALMEDRSLPSNAHPAVWAPFVVVGEGGSDGR